MNDGAITTYRSALNQQLLYPSQGEVKEALKQLETMVLEGGLGKKCL